MLHSVFSIEKKTGEKTTSSVVFAHLWSSANRSQTHLGQCLLNAIPKYKLHVLGKLVKVCTRPSWLVFTESHRQLSWGELL